MDWQNEIWLERNTSPEFKSGVYTRDVLANLIIARDFNNYELRIVDQDELDTVYYDPFLMQDMDKAVERVHEAIENKESIVIHGDYDSDGFTSSSILYTFFRRLGHKDVSVFIPNRLEDGYGLSEHTVNKVLDLEPDLVITVDCGVKSNEEISYLKTKGVDTVVTDHHMPGKTLPEDSIATVDPHIDTDTYPFNDLCGAGVAFKLCQAYIKKYDLDASLLKDLAALAMIGTIADVMPLRDENRHIVKHGLREIKQGSLSGIRALIRHLNIDINKVRATDFAFRICPRINAAGRLANNDIALNLLLTDKRDPEATIKAIEENNDLRKAEQDKALVEIEGYFREHPEILSEPLILLKGKTWHPGIIGIIAARIQDKWQKPCIVCTEDSLNSTEDNILLKGSGRSTGEFNLHKVVSAAKDYMVNFGGHQNACGLTVKLEDWPEFSKAILEAAEEETERLSADLSSKAKLLTYDLEIAPEAVNLVEAMSLKVLEPFGQDNPEPVFLIRDLPIKAISILSQGKHLKLDLDLDTAASAICFGFGPYYNILKDQKKLTVLAKLEINAWNGHQDPQLNVEAIAYPGEDKYLIADYIDPEELAAEEAAEYIDAEDLITFWELILDLTAGNEAIISLKRLQHIFTANTTKLLDIEKLRSILSIYVEAGLITILSKLDKYTYYLAMSKPESRAKLSNTDTAKELIKTGVLRL